MTGGGSQLTHLDKALTDYCGIEAKVANPFRNIDLFGDNRAENEKIARLSPYMATAIGLALRGVG